MKGFKVTALTGRGKKALKRHIANQKAQPRLVRMFFSQMFEEEIGPDFLKATVKVGIVGARMLDKDVVERLKESFAIDACIIDVDFSVEVF